MFGSAHRIFARSARTKTAGQARFMSTSSSFSNVASSRFAVPFLAATAVAAGALYAYNADAKEEEKQDVKKALNPKDFKPFTVTEVVPYNYNSKLIRFELKDDEILGLDVASALVVRAPIGEDGKQVIRPYTPISDNDDRGHWDLLVKVYEKGVMSKHLGDLKPGDTLEVKGPIPKLQIKPNMKKRIAMIAGGSGITPMYQVVNELIKAEKDSKEKTELTLLFANISEDDILLKETFDRLAKENSNFKVHYLIEKHGQDWKGEVGRVTTDLAKRLLPPPSDEHLVLVCGPPPMMNAVSGGKAPDYSQGEVSGILKDLGYTKDQVYKF
ncbi:hypothetical protein PROFUN_01543 [Planoprotostelium fungivorum]|uniref:NADH-cytochrome b5 reductase n=1 Tax=Planoprotostelium fungivorum TaxID=1890364 RepID=A0A2P6NTK6_9EUKA|nr:hypothetical protein PROFUN_01543 [Planoprotostelium fungivorum]